MKLPSVADVNELRVIRFKEKITEAVLSGAGREFQPLLEQIETDANIPAIEIAAALASLMQGSTPLFLAQKAEPEQKAPPNIDGSQPTQTYRIEVGHAQGVLPGNIVGAIANEAGIEGRHIGHIDIRDDHSYVDLPELADEMLGSLQDVRVRGEAIRIKRVDSKPEKTRFSGKSMRPDRMAEEREERRPDAGAKRPYIGGGNRFDKAGEPRPYESKRTQSRNYKGTPRFKGPEQGSAPAEGGERPAFARGKPSFGKPSFGKPAFGGKPGSFKKKFVGKAAGAKGSYKGGKSFRDKSG
jgi:ATP-dependent RNA helicase DeaD